MNQSTATARGVIQHLIDAGVRHIVVAPGSRSAGLAFAAAQAAAVNAVTLHTRIDEREVGFLALGLSKANRDPVAVIVTSGTAVANLVPAMVEAHMTGLPLIAVTADRPASLRFSGAAQTINQPPMFAPYVASSVDLPVGTAGSGLVDLTPVAAALNAALVTRRQPVHLNVQADLPLLPDATDLDWTPVLARRAETAAVSDVSEAPEDVMTLAPRGIMIVGDVADPADADAAGRLAESLGWPLLWEPSSNAHGAVTAVSHGPLIASSMPVPDMVMTVGTVGLSRSVMAMLKATPHHIAVHLAANGPMRPDPGNTAAVVVAGIPTARCTPDDAWLAMWRDADRAAASIIEPFLGTTVLSGPSVAAQMWNHLASDAWLLVGASWPVRHVEAFATTRKGVRVFGNRGTNGIDGLLSTGVGLALTHAGRTYALVGDVSFLYGSGGLLGSADADLTVVVVDNDGSGIFSQLEQGQSMYAEHFERLFGTPHGRDLWVVAEALGVPASRVTTRDELAAALRRSDAIPGAHVIVCTTGSRADEAAMLARVSSAVATACSTS